MLHKVCYFCNKSRAHHRRLISELVIPHTNTPIVYNNNSRIDSLKMLCAIIVIRQKLPVGNLRTDLKELLNLIKNNYVWIFTKFLHKERPVTCFMCIDCIINRLYMIDLYRGMQCQVCHVYYRKHNSWEKYPIGIKAFLEVHMEFQFHKFYWAFRQIEYFGRSELSFCTPAPDRKPDGQPWIEYQPICCSCYEKIIIKKD